MRHTEEIVKYFSCDFCGVLSDVDEDFEIPESLDTFRFKIQNTTLHPYVNFILPQEIHLCVSCQNKVYDFINANLARKLKNDTIK